MRGLLVALILAVAACEAEPIPTKLAIEPATVEIWQDETVQLKAVVYDQNGEVYNEPLDIMWESGDPSIAEISDGLVTPQGWGPVRVSATAAVLDLDAIAAVSIQRIYDLRATAAYINQVNQDPNDPIGVLIGRKGLLRLYLTMEENVSYSPPPARVKLLQGSTVLLDTVLTQELPDFLVNVDQSSLENSYNLLIPAELVVSGLEVDVEYDPEDTERALSGHERIDMPMARMPVFYEKLVPIVSTRHRSSHGEEWAAEQKPFEGPMRMAGHVLPVSEWDLSVRAVYETDVNLNHGQSAWIGLLNELSAVRAADGLRSYYYGAIRPPYYPGGGIYGIGFIAHPVSLGNTDGITHAHELGHNMGLGHAPCGVYGDPDFPDESGRIEYWGWDPSDGSLRTPRRFNDIMGYCQNNWVHPYHFEKATKTRQRLGLDVEGPAQDVLMVWGTIYEGQLQLEPAFVLRAPVTLPDPRGLYLAVGHADGKQVFSHRFTPHEIAGVNAAGFNVRIPWQSVESVTVSGPPGSAMLVAGSHPPAAIIMDENGQIRRIARNWQGGQPTGARVLVSTGLPTEVLR